MKTPHFIVDDRGKKIGVLLTVEDCESLLSAPNKLMKLKNYSTLSNDYFGEFWNA